jgi:hypothetical protein
MTVRELTNELAALLRKEHAAMADFLLALAAFDSKQRWRELGHTSLFYFLRRELGLSAGAAQYRKTAAELIQRFPAVEQGLREGKLCLSTIVDVAKVLTPENAAEVLPRFFGLSHREAEQVAVSIKPVEAPPQREVVTSVRAAVDPSQVAPSCSDESQPLVPDSEAERVRTSEMPLAPARRDSTEPLAPDISRVHFTASRRFLDKLDAARDALSHSNRGASMEEILEAGLDLVLAQHAKRKGLVAKPQNAVRPSKPDHIPARVKRKVWRRAGGRCEWEFESGERCDCTTRLEFDHITPRALGGASDEHNARLLCDAHNDLAARRVFGDRMMDRYSGKARRRRMAPTQAASAPDDPGGCACQQPAIRSG